MSLTSILKIKTDLPEEEKKSFVRKLRIVIKCLWGGEIAIISDDRGVYWTYDRRITKARIKERLAGMMSKLKDIVFIRDGVTMEEYFEALAIGKEYNVQL